MFSDKGVTSSLRGTGSFPRLGVAFDDARVRLAPDRKTSAPVRFSGRNFSRLADGALILPPACGSSPGDTRAALTQGRGRGARPDPQDWLHPSELGRAGISAAPPRNLRSAAVALRSRRCERAQQALHLNGGNTPPHALWQSSRRAAGTRSRATGSDGCERYGARD